MKKNIKKIGKTRSKHSKNLKLAGPVPDYSKYKIRKNQEVPPVRQIANHWDHLIAKLDAGDSIEMEQKEAMSLTNRARNIGYVIVSRKTDDNTYLVWFGGLK